MKKLQEGLLHSEFTFGFELEAILRGDSTIADDAYEDYSRSGDEYIDLVHNEIKNTLDYYLKSGSSPQVSGKSYVHVDSSIDPDNDEDFPFEYSSPILMATPKNFARVIKLLSEMPKNDMRTNDTCGFHHHLSFKGMSYRDLVWIYCCLACDTDALKKFSEFNGHEFKHWNYASFDNILSLASALLEREWDKAAEYIDDEKYRAFRLHPQGTLEWRGPREFLDKNNIEEIKGFYKLFSLLISKVSAYMDMDTLPDSTISKKEFFKELDERVPALKVSSEKPIQNKTISKFLNKLDMNFDTILKIMKDKNLDTFFRKIAKDSVKDGGYDFMSRVVGIVGKNVDRGFYKKEQRIEIAKYLYSVFSPYVNGYKIINCFDLFLHHEMKYIYSEKMLEELLENAKSFYEYRAYAEIILKMKIGMKLDKPIEHVMKFVRQNEVSESAGSTVPPLGVYRWVSYYLTNDGSTVNFLTPREAAQLGMILMNRFLTDPYYTTNLKKTRVNDTVIYLSKDVERLIAQELPSEIKKFREMLEKYKEITGWQDPRETQKQRQSE